MIAIPRPDSDAQSGTSAERLFQSNPSPSSSTSMVSVPPARRRLYRIFESSSWRLP